MTEKHRTQWHSETGGASLFLRADGNGQIGMGHVMRCIPIAKAAQALGARVHFVTADEGPKQTVLAAGIDCLVLDSSYLQMEEELPLWEKLLAAGEQTDKRVILVDSYQVTPAYLEGLRTYGRVILMDDNRERVYPCDGLINYNIYAEDLLYPELYGQEIPLFLGPKWMPLREEFQALSEEPEKQPAVQENPQEQLMELQAGEEAGILLTSGGGDQLHMMRRFLTWLWLKKSPLCSRTFHVIQGPFCEDGEALRELALQMPALCIHQNVTNMSEIMKHCSMAVSAAGSTLYELCALGIPAVSYSVAANQHRNLEAFARRTGLVNAGDFQTEGDQIFLRIEAALLHWILDTSSRREAGLRMRGMVDGKGSMRLAEALLGSDRSE